jgi:hypothetical protein
MPVLIGKSSTSVNGSHEGWRSLFCCAVGGGHSSDIRPWSHTCAVRDGDRQRRAGHDRQSRAAQAARRTFEQAQATPRCTAFAPEPSGSWTFWSRPTLRASSQTSGRSLPSHYETAADRGSRYWGSLLSLAIQASFWSEMMRSHWATNSSSACAAWPGSASGCRPSRSRSSWADEFDPSLAPPTAALPHCGLSMYREAPVCRRLAPRPTPTTDADGNLLLQLTPARPPVSVRRADCRLEHRHIPLGSRRPPGRNVAGSTTRWVTSVWARSCTIARWCPSWSWVVSGPAPPDADLVSRLLGAGVRVPRSGGAVLPAGCAGGRRQAGADRWRRTGSPRLSRNGHTICGTPACPRG